MKKSRFTDSQIVDALKRVEADLAVSELCRELGISTATFYKWRSKFGGMDTGVAPIKPDTVRPNGLGCAAVVISSASPYAGATRCNH